MAEEKKKYTHPLFKRAFDVLIKNLIYIASGSGLLHKPLTEIDPEQCLEILHKNKEGSYVRKGKLVNCGNFAGQMFDDIVDNCLENKIDAYLEGMVEYYFPSLSNRVVHIETYDDMQKSLLRINVVPLENKEEMLYVYYDTVYDEDDFIEFYKYFKAYCDNKGLKNSSSNLIVVSIDNIVEPDIRDAYTIRHAQFIIIEIFPNLVNAYLYDTFSQEKSHYVALEIIRRLFARYFNKSELSTGHEYVNLLSPVHLQDQTRDYDKSIEGLCEQYNVMMLYCVLAVNKYLHGSIPIHHWGRGIEKVLMRTFSQCQIVLLVVLFNLVVYRYVVFQRNLDHQKKIFSNLVNNIVAILDNKDSKEQIQKYYLAVTHPDREYPVNIQTWKSALTQARSIKRRQRRTKTKTKGKDPY